MRPDVSQKRDKVKQAVTDLLADYISEYQDLTALIDLKRVELNKLEAQADDLQRTIDTLKSSEREMTDEVV